MRRVLAALALLLLPGLALAEQPRTNAFSTAGAVEWGQALTDAGYFGLPRTATASLPTCNTANKGAARFDTTLGGAIVCNGTAWTSIGSSSGPILFPDGTAGAPSWGWNSDADGSGTGMFRPGANAIGVAINGSEAWRFDSSYFRIGSLGCLGFNSASAISSGGVDGFVCREAAASFQLGNDNAAGAAVDQTISAADAITAADISGGDLTIQSGAGMGTGTVSALIFQTPTVAAAGANPQSLATRLTVSSAGSDFTGTVTSTANIIAGATQNLGFSGRALFASPSNGVMQAINNAASDFDTLRLGPTASADTGVVTLESMNSGTAGFLITSNTAASGGADVGITLKTVGDLGSGDSVFVVQDNNGTQLFAISGTSIINAGNTTQIPTLVVSGIFAHSTRQSATVDAATTFAVTSNYVLLACTGAETINTITGGQTGAVIYIENSDTECTIADDDDATASNAIDLTGVATNDVGAIAKVITLIYNGTHWLQVAESDN